jgi:hypothetical protein
VVEASGRGGVATTVAVMPAATVDRADKADRIDRIDRIDRVDRD